MGKRVNLPHVTFSSGEVDPLMAARDDTKAYHSGLSKCRNFRLLSKGGLTRRPGSRVLTVLPDSVRFHSFVFNISQRYLFILSAGRLDVYHDDGTLATSLTSQPWAESQLDSLYFASSGDTTIICHKDMVTTKILRTGVTSFVSSAFAFETTDPAIDPPKTFQPYFKFASFEVTMQSSATAIGTTTLTASAFFFVDDHVGTYIRINEDGAGFKQVKITAVSTPFIATGSIIEVLSGTSATVDWDEQVISVVRGFPQTVLFYLSRLWFGGTRDLPAHIFSSKVSAFFNFDEGEGLADESIQGGIQADRISEIKGMLGLRNLLIFTDQGEGSVSHSDSNPLTPGSFNFDKDTPYGSGDVPPVELDGAALFVQISGKALREFFFRDIDNAHVSPNVSLTASHLIRTPVDIAVSFGSPDQPEQYAYLVNSDGTIAQYHTIRDEKVTGWSLWETDGLYQRVANVGDVVFTAVSRLTATNPFSSDFSDDFGPAARTTYLEIIDATKTIDMVQSDSSLVPVTEFTGFDLLKGRQVDVVEDNIYHGSFMVSDDGEISLPEPALTIDAGLNYTPQLQTLPAAISGSSGILIAEWKRLIEATLVIHETLGVVVHGEELIVRQVTDDLSLQPNSLTGRRQFALGGYTREAQLTVTQIVPLPMTILGIQLTISVP